MSKKIASPVIESIDLSPIAEVLEATGLEVVTIEMLTEAGIDVTEATDAFGADPLTAEMIDAGEAAHAAPDGLTMPTMTWADVLDFASAEAIDSEDFGLAGVTEPEWTITRSQTWRIVVFALASRTGSGYFINVDEITTNRHVNTRITGSYKTADLAMRAVELLTRFVNGWSMNGVI